MAGYHGGDQGRPPGEVMVVKVNCFTTPSPRSGRRSLLFRPARSGPLLRARSGPLLRFGDRSAGRTTNRSRTCCTAAIQDQLADDVTGENTMRKHARTADAVALCRARQPDRSPIAERQRRPSSSACGPGRALPVGRMNIMTPKDVAGAAPARERTTGSSEMANGRIAERADGLVRPGRRHGPALVEEVEGRGPARQSRAEAKALRGRSWRIGRTTAANTRDGEVLELSVEGPAPDMAR